jgi:hypothetical protein
MDTPTTLTDTWIWQRNRPTRRTAPGPGPAEAAAERADMLREIDVLRREVTSLKLRLPTEAAPDDNVLPAVRGKPEDRSSLSTPLATETAALERKVQQVDEINARLHTALDTAVAENNGLRRTLAMLRQQERGSGSNHPDGKLPATKTCSAALHGGGGSRGAAELAAMESRLVELREDFE